MKAKAVVHLKFPSSRQLYAIMAALSPEINQPVLARAQINVKIEAAFLIIEAEADDTIALRSALNAYLRWIDSIKNVFSVLDTVSQEISFF